MMKTVAEMALTWKIPEQKVTYFCRNGRIHGAIKQGNQWFIPENTEKPIDARTRIYKEKQNQKNSVFYYETTKSSYDASEHVRAAYEKTYRKKPQEVRFAPYRICPLGAHVDHNLGWITGFAIDKGIYMAYSLKTNGVVEISSLQFPKRAQWHVMATPPVRQNDWADLLRGATIALAKRHPLQYGLSAILDGELPIGGLSSSATVVLTFITSLAKLNGIQLRAKELMEISRESENQYLGVSSGKLDQSCEIYCQKDKLLFMDTLTDEKEIIPMNPAMKPFEIAIFFSGLERSLAGSRYNMRVDELKAAAYDLAAYAGYDYGRFADIYARDIPEDVYLAYRDRLPESFRRRADHFYSECRRAKDGAEAWRNGNLEEFGQLIFESGRSSIKNWETGCPELIKLYEIMTQTDGIYGGRFSGAGFKGCCMALIDPEKRESILENVQRAYLSAFPEMEGKYSAHICHTAEGVRW